MIWIRHFTELLGRILPIGFVILMIISVWTYFSNEEYNDDEITFTVSCNSVLRNGDQYPIWMIEECKRIKGL